MAIAREPPLKHDHPDCKDGCTGKRTLKKRGDSTWYYCPCKCHRARNR